MARTFASRFTFPAIQFRANLCRQDHARRDLGALHRFEWLTPGHAPARYQSGEQIPGVQLGSAHQVRGCLEAIADALVEGARPIAVNVGIERGRAKPATRRPGFGFAHQRLTDAAAAHRVVDHQRLDTASQPLSSAGRSKTCSTPATAPSSSATMMRCRPPPSRCRSDGGTPPCPARSRAGRAGGGRPRSRSAGRRAGSRVLAHVVDHLAVVGQAAHAGELDLAADLADVPDGVGHRLLEIGRR
jgi:hypothetical protein